MALKSNITCTDTPVALWEGITGQKSHYIHQLTTMLPTSNNILFPGHNHLLTTGADDPSLYLSPRLVLG